MDQGCGSGACGCAGTSGATLTAAQEAGYETLAALVQPVARVNGVALHAAGEAIDAEVLRQRACTELLRQAAQQADLLAADDVPGTDGATSEQASQAIEQLLEGALRVPNPSEEACQRHYDALTALHRQGERVQLRHVLFAVTPGVDVKLLRQRAEAMLVQLRCADDGGASFAAAAREWSNCPSGEQGGALGWLERGDCAPEFAREVFGAAEIGVLARLVHSRFGLHVVEVLARDGGQQLAFEAVRPAVEQTLRQQAWVNALRQYLQLLAGAAVLEGVDMDSATSPLVQ